MTNFDQYIKARIESTERDQYGQIQYSNCMPAHIFPNIDRGIVEEIVNSGHYQISLFGNKYGNYYAIHSKPSIKTTDKMKVIEFTVNGNQDHHKLNQYASQLGLKVAYQRFEGVGYRIYYKIDDNTNEKPLIEQLLLFANNNGIYAYHIA